MRHVDEWHDGVDVFVEEINTCWNEIEVTWTGRSELIGCKDAVGLFGI